MRVKCFMLTLFVVFLALTASAQQVLTIRGVVSKKSGIERVSQVLIRNLRSDEIMMSDELGWFTVKAAVGDTLLFRKQEYADQKIVVVNGNDLPVYMQPVINLATVTVQGQSTRQELKDVMAGYRKDGTFYDGKPPALSFLTNPITAFYELFGATPNAAKHFAAYSKQELEYAEITRRYTPILVKRVTNAPDSVIKKFMQYYVPTYEDLKGWNDYDLMKQVKKRYDYYEANKDRLKTKDLSLPPLSPKANLDGNPE
jgi:hypothetical protein